MYRKALPLVLVLTLVGLIGAAVATAAGPTEDTGSSSKTTIPAVDGSDRGGAVLMRLSLETESGGRMDPIHVLGYSHEVVSPRDAASGLPTGKRQHKPLMIAKQVDKSTPLLYNVLVNNENVTAARLDFIRTSRAGKEEVYFTIELTNASIAGIQSERPFDEAGRPREHISFTYQKIIWTWQDGGITAEDDWETPVS